jgi:hypothetical protein
MRAILLGIAAALCCAPRAQAQPEPLHLYLHVTEASPRTFDAAARTGLLLMEEGFDVVDVRPVNAMMRRTTIRYFYRDLRDDAYRLKATLEHLLRAQGIGHPQVRVQDFTFYEPKTPRHSVEVWFETQ